MGVSISAIDLFCGAGGLTHGFEQAGLPVTVGYDIDPACRYPYEQNNNSRFALKNVEQLCGADLEEDFSGSQVRVLVGCAPCQPFSTYSRRYKSKGVRWKLVQDFGRLVYESQPEVVSMENVLQLQDHPIFPEFTKQLKNLEYSVSTYEVNCLDYGVPQTRKRLVLLASRLGAIELVQPSQKEESNRTVFQAIKHLDPLVAGQASKVDRIHCCSRLSKLNLQRIRASKPGGTWRDWPNNLVAKCHTKESGMTYPGVYGRMEWNRPSPTITTQCFGFGNGRFGHPEQDRAISLREAAILQTFPEDYEFVEPSKPVVFKHVGRLIGNAVPVSLGKAIADSILKHVED